MGLKEEECFEVRSLVVDRLWVEFDGETIVKSLQELVFVATNGDHLELGRGGNDLQQTLELRPFLERERVHVNSYVYLRR